MDIDEDDPVVSEIPVYLCKELSKQLHLFQFPNLSSDFSHYTKKIESSRVKPQNGVIELDYKLNTDSDHYDDQVGEALASNTNDSSKPHNEDDPIKLFEKLALRSNHSVLKKDIDCYSVAGVYDGKFCISTLQDAHIFIPSSEHKEGEEKPNAKNANAGSDLSDDDGEDANSAIPITVKFTHKNNEKAKMSQEQSCQQQLMKIAEEPWCETKFYHSTTSTAMRKVEGLTKTVSRNRTPMMSLSEEQYFDVLMAHEAGNLTIMKEPRERCTSR